MTTGSEAERAGMNDGLSGRQARLIELLEMFDKLKRLYAADWGIAYDLQRAQQLIEREIRNCAERATEEEDGGGSLRIAAIKGERL